MSKGKRKSRIITRLDVVDENAKQKRKARRRARLIRQKKIDGPSRRGQSQTIRPSHVMVVSKTGLAQPGSRIYVCPRCDGKKKMQRIMEPDKGWVLPPGVKHKTIEIDCVVCNGKGHIWV